MRKFFIGFSLLFILLNYTNCLVLGIAATAATGAVIAEERSVGSVLDDNVDVNSIRLGLSKKKEIYKDMHVEVFEGRVLLTGRVDSAEDKENLDKLIWPVSRVIEIINEVDIKKGNQEYYMNNIIQDYWINANIRSKLLFNRKTKSLNYKIVVYNKKIYFIGVAKSQGEINSLLEVVSNISGVKKVKSFIILKEDKRRNKKIS